jgi:Protein of unknown function (DUF2752)
MSSPAPTGRRKLAFGLFMAALLGGVAVLYFVDPHAPGHYPPCPFYFVTGLDCPACGFTRGAHDLLHLRPARGFWQNPLVFLVLPFGVVWLVRESWRLWVDASLRPWNLSGRWLTAALILTVVYTVLRNLPWWPFSLLGSG